MKVKKKDEALKFLPKLNSELMKIAKTGIIKKQNASRNVSRITKKIAACNLYFKLDSTLKNYADIHIYDLSFVLILQYLDLVNIWIIQSI